MKEDKDNLPGMWEETFKTHTDSKPRGVDFVLTRFIHVITT